MDNYYPGGRVTLSPDQHRLVAEALRIAAAVELAMGEPEVAGLRLVSYLSEAREASKRREGASP